MQQVLPYLLQTLSVAALGVFLLVFNIKYGKIWLKKIYDYGIIRACLNGGEHYDKRYNFIF